MLRDPRAERGRRRRLRLHAHARRDAATPRRRRGPAPGPDREPARARPLLPRLLGAAAAGARRRCAVQGLRLARLRGLRHARAQGLVSVREVDVEPSPEQARRDERATTPSSTLRDVPGPSALGGGWRRCARAAYLIAVTDFKKDLLRHGARLPLVARAAADAVRRAARGLHAGLPDRLGRAATIRSCCCSTSCCSASSRRRRHRGDSIVTQESVVRKTQFPRLVIPLAVVLTSLFNLGLNLVVVFAFVLGWAIDPTVDVAALPAVLVALFVLTTAVSMIVSSLYPRFRDTAIIWSVAATVLFYATARALPDREACRPRSRDILALNPFTPLLELGREWVIDPSAPGPVEVAGGSADLLPADCDLRRRLHASRSGSSGARRRGSPSSSEPAWSTPGAPARSAGRRGGAPVPPRGGPLRAGHARRKGDVGERHPALQAALPPQPAGARPENPLQFDSAYVFEPDGLAVREALRDGRLPVWSPDLEAGWPLLATQQSAPLFPLTWIGVVFPYWESLAWIAVIKLCAGRTRNLPVRPRAWLRPRARAAGRGRVRLRHLPRRVADAPARQRLRGPAVAAPRLAARLCRTGAAARRRGARGPPGRRLPERPARERADRLARDGGLGHVPAGLRPPRPPRGAPRSRRSPLAAVLLGAAIGAVMIVPLVEALRESFITSALAAAAAGQGRASALAFPEYWGRPDGPLFDRALELHRADALRWACCPRCSRSAGLFAARPRGPQLFFAGLAVVSLAVALDTGPVSALVGRPAGARPGRSAPGLILASFGDRDARGLRAPAPAGRHRPAGGC